MAKVCYKNLPSDEAKFKEIDRDYLIGCAYEFARTSDDDLYNLIMREKVSLSVNGDIIHPDDWYGYKLEANNEVIIYPILSGGKGGAFIQIIVGGALMALGGPISTALGVSFITPGVILSAGLSMVLGGISYLLFKPTLPTLSYFGDSESSQTYNWSGVSTITQSDAPVPIVYGTHPVGGNLISAFTEGYGENNYLYMLIALCEGEIEGICREDNKNLVCTTTNRTDTSNYYDPSIKIDDQPLSSYERDSIDWWYRSGTNTIDIAKDQYDPTAQNLIPHFDGTRIQYDDGRDLTTTGVVYTTTKEVDMANIQISMPALFGQNKNTGEIEERGVKFKIEFKTESAENYTTYGVNKYSASVSANVGNAKRANTISVSYKGETDHYGSPSPSYTIYIEKQEFADFASDDISSKKSYNIYIKITNNSNNMSEERIITNKIERMVIPNYVLDTSFQITTQQDGWNFGPNNYIDSIIEIDGVYNVQLGRNIKSGEEYVISSTFVETVELVPITGKTKNGFWRSVLLDFNNNGSGRDVYMIRVSRENEQSTLFSTENKMSLSSVTEIVNGDFIYPNTALLALRIKATGQISGAMPNIVTLVKGTKISVPSITEGNDFDDVWWDSSQSRWENSDGIGVNWDESTWSTQYSDNSMLCVRDLLINNRYGLGQYLSTSDLYTTGIITAIKKCHTKYDPYTGGQPDLMDWWDGRQDSLWSGHWELGNTKSGSSNSTARTITLDGTLQSYSIRCKLDTAMLKRGTYTFSITVSGLSHQAILLVNGYEFYNPGEKVKLFFLGQTTIVSSGTSTISNITVPIDGIKYIHVGLSINSKDAAKAYNLSCTITDISLSSTNSDDHYHTFDGVLDTSQSALTVLSEMCNAFRCWPVWFDGKFNFIIDEDETPIHTISMGNMISGSFSQAFTPLSEIPYKLEGQYTDAALDYDLRTLMTIATNSDLVKTNKRSVGLKGITSRQKAERELKFKLNKVINCTHQIAFKCGLDSIHATAGDVINIQHDLPAWGAGGRILDYDSVVASLTMEATFPFTDINATYIIRYQDVNNDFVTATVTSTGVKQTIGVQSWPNTDPCDNAVYAVGALSTYVKPFRLISAARTEDNDVQVTALEHIDIYTEPSITVIDDNYSKLPSDIRKPSPPINIDISYDPGGNEFILSAEPNLKDVSIVKDIVVEFSSGTDYNFQVIAIIPIGKGSVTYQYSKIKSNIEYRFKFYCRTAFKNSDPVYMSTMCSSSPSLQDLPPSSITINENSPLTMTWPGKDVVIKWNPSGSSVLEGLFAKSKGYFIEIYKDSISKSNILRTEYTRSTEFKYTYEMNKVDSANVLNNPSSIPSSTLLFILYSVSNSAKKSPGTKPFKITNTVPSAPTGLTSDGWMGSVDFIWNESIEDDFNYFSYRTKITDSTGAVDSGWGSWINIFNNKCTRQLSESEIQTYGSNAIVYIEVKTIDLFMQESSAATNISGTSTVGLLYDLYATYSIGASGDATSLYDGDLDSGGVTIG